MSEEIGPIIRRRRQALGMSLEALAQRSGVSTTMLSEVERSLKNPTVKLAYQIARALDCSLTDLLADEPAARVSVVRASERRSFVDPDSGLVRAGQRSELLNRNLELAWYTLPPGQATGTMPPNRPGLVEQILVLSGSLVVELSARRYSLAEGDSITYGVQDTNYVNEREEPCVFLLLSDFSGVG